MAPAAYWKGYLKLSLVTCAVQMTPATTRAARVSFHTLNRETGNRLRIQLVDEGSREPVDDEDIVKGYEVGKDEYVLVTDEELDDVALDSTHTIDIGRFVPRDEVDSRYFDKAYFLAPDDDVAQEPFAVIRDAMAQSDQVGLGRVVLGYRERQVTLQPRGKGILVWRLKYDYEVRSEEAVFERIEEAKPDAALLKLTEEVMAEKRARFSPKTFTDPLQEAQLKIIAAKKKHRKAPKLKIGTPAADGGRKVVSMMEALKKSLAAEKKSAKAPRRTVAAAKALKNARGGQSKRSG